MSRSSDQRPPRLSLPLRVVWVCLLLVRVTVASGGTFPGTLKDWWHPTDAGTNIGSGVGSGSSSSGEGESSSDWDWVDDPEEELSLLATSSIPSSTLIAEASQTTGTTGSTPSTGSGNSTADTNRAYSTIPVVDPTENKPVEVDQATAGPTPTPTPEQPSALGTDKTSNNLSMSSVDSKSVSMASNTAQSGTAPMASTSTYANGEIQSNLPRQDLPSNKPLQTLEKLQQMLDDTDYLTTSRRSRQDDDPMDEYDADDPPTTGLWTSKDRSKYKRQQRGARTMPTTTSTATTKATMALPMSPPKQVIPPPDPQLPRFYPAQPPPPPSVSISDTTMSSDVEDPSDTDDGLGYTLPNLPVYLSDDEGDTQDHLPWNGGNEEEVAAASRQQPTLMQQQQQVPPQIPNQQIYPPGMLYPPYPYQNAPPQLPYGYYPPPPPPPSQQYYMHPAYAGWGPQGYYHPQPHVPRVDGTRRPRYPASPQTPSSLLQPPLETVIPSTVVATPTFSVEPIETQRTKSPTTFRLNLDSITKVATCLALSGAVCYAAVSPHSLPFLQYNQKFYQGLRVASLTAVVPLVVSILVIDPVQNQLSDLVNGFYHAFTIGYALTFALEILAATATRLAVFFWLEPNVFKITPQVPLLVAPWVLREQKVLVKPITLIVQDLVTSTFVCPLIEEWIKLVLLQWTIPLKKNFRWVTKPSKSNPKRRKWVAEPLESTTPMVNINSYVSGMLAVSVGLKLADSIRRVCMYTKADDRYKAFYAFCRGLFPIPELCGTVTALGLARRDVLGQKMPLWKLLLPAAVIHGMANFRGMKPVFKWNSSTPWTEMQLSTNFLTEGATMAQLASKAFPKVMWLIILFRVTGYCIKNYYMINRQAVKRTTTYAGKHAAFSAELEAAEMLKKTQKEK